MTGLRGLLSLVAMTILIAACGQAPDGSGQPVVTAEDEARAALGSQRSAPGTHQALATAPTGANACAPKVVPFVPRAWVPPGPARLAACTTQQVRAVAGCVWASGTTVSPACAAFWAATQNEQCVKCAYTGPGDPVHGPIFDDGTWVSNNYPACIAAASGDRTATSCAATFEAALDCYSKACDHCLEDDAYWACTAAADEGMCKPYRHGWTCAESYFNTCFGDTATDDAVKIISLLCAP